MPSDNSKSQSYNDERSTMQVNSTQTWNEDRLEYVSIPHRGKLQTQIFETRTRVHCYFDPDEATWLRLPITWELQSPAACHLVNLVKVVCPEWIDDADILAALRVSNYNVDDCVNTYHSSIGRQPSIPMTSRENTSSSLKGKTATLPAPTTKHRVTSPQEMGDEKYDELVNQIEILKQQLQDSQAELSLEKEAHDQLKLSVANEKKRKSIETESDRSTLCVKQSVEQLRQSCRELHEVLDCMKDFIKELVSTLISLMKRSKRLFAEQKSKLIEARALYRLESQQRRLTYNMLIELRGNIRVICRIRPVDGISRARCFLQEHEPGDLTAHLPNSTKRQFQFDHIFHMDSSQEQVFEKLSDIIASSVDGYNVCIMAYGQTGSGKTYTMEGPPDKPGVNILSIRELLRIVKKRKKVDFQLTMSILEIYNENVVDLLSPADASDSVEIRHTNQMVSVVGATWVQVKNEQDMHDAISKGQKGRHVAATRMNSCSSRSHLIVSVCVDGTDKISHAMSHGQLTLCDLAGSERVEKSGITSGERFHEATQINRSLSALAQVFVALRNNQLHIPYRNTKLTQMLQPCLGGDAKTCLIVNVTSDPTSVSETLSTLQFATNARQVALGPAKAHLSGSTFSKQSSSRMVE